MRQTILTFILVILLAVGGYIWYSRQQSAEAPLAVEGAPRGLDTRLAQYERLKNLKPDTGIFSDPLFKSLAPAFSPRPAPGAPGFPAIGRPNPFAPL